MTQGHLERVENLHKYCKETPDKAPCCTPYDVRLDTMHRFVDAFKSLGSEIFSSNLRTGIVLFLYTLDGACVCEVQAALNESRQPLVSHHLRQLKKKGYLVSERRGRWTYYMLSETCRESLSQFIKILGER